MKICKKTFFTCLLSLGLASCSGWNSELNTLNLMDDKGDLRPKCQFKTKDNCFTRSVRLLMECSENHSGVDEILTEDFRLCSNEKGKRVVFDTPLDLVGDFSKEDLSYSLYAGQSKCFRFTGTSHAFVIDQNAFGVLEVRPLENGDTQVSCFFGESFTISNQIKEQGCRGEKTKASEFIPRATLQESASPELLPSSDPLSFRFSFLGADQPKPVFNCQL